MSRLRRIKRVNYMNRRARRWSPYTHVHAHTYVRGTGPRLSDGLKLSLKVAQDRAGLSVIARRPIVDFALSHLASSSF